MDHQRARRAHLADGFGGGVLLFERGRSARGLRPRFRAGSLLGFRRLPRMGRSNHPDLRGRAPERHRNRFEDRLRDGVARRRLHLHREGRRRRLHPRRDPALHRRADRGDARHRRRRTRDQRAALPGDIHRIRGEGERRLCPRRCREKRRPDLPGPGGLGVR